MYKFAVEYAEQNGYGDLAIAITVVGAPVILLALAFGWIMGQRSAYASLRKTYAETSKTTHESQLKYRELLASIEDYRDKLDEHKRQLDKLLIEIRDVLRLKRVKRLRDARDSLCDFHAKTYVPTFLRYLELCHSVLPKDEQYLRMIGEIIPALETQANLIEAVNADQFFDRIKTGAKYRVNRGTARMIFIRARKGVPIWRLSARSRLRPIFDSRACDLGRFST